MEAKKLAKRISCDAKCKFNSTTCNSNEKWNNKTCQCECKNYICYGYCIKKKTNNIATNVSVNCQSKKVRDCYILHTVLLVTILLLIITIICYHYAKHRSKQKDINVLTI